MRGRSWQTVYERGGKQTPYSLLNGINGAHKQPSRNHDRPSSRQYLFVGLIIFGAVAASIVVLYGLPRETYAQYPLQNVVSLQLQTPKIASVQLNVPFCDQDESVNKQYDLPGTCWDASTEMILNYWGSKGYLTSVPTQGEIYSYTMGYGDGGNLNAALASLGFYTAEFNPHNTLYASYSDYHQVNNALNATQMIYTAQVALSLGAPLLATVETQPYPQATVATGGILCDSRGGDHAVAITGYNQTGFFFNSATNEQFNPQFVSDSRLNTYARLRRVVNGYNLYCPYSEFVAAYSNDMWCFTAIFPVGYAPIIQQQRIQLVNENGNPLAGMLVSSPFSSAQTDSNGYATLNITAFGSPISVGFNIHASGNGSCSGEYGETSDMKLGYSLGGDFGIYMLYPSAAANWQATRCPQIEYLR